jgi:hypothetical protein
MKEVNALKRRGDNWYESLVEYAKISGVFAGFCLTFIAILLQGRINEIIVVPGIKLNDITITILGLSVILFIFASQRFLRANECIIWYLPEKYVEFMNRVCNDSTGDKQSFDFFELAQDCETDAREYEKQGRYAYNISLALMTLGLAFVIFVYNPAVGIIIGVAGISLEIFQAVEKKGKKVDQL